MHSAARAVLGLSLLLATGQAAPEQDTPPAQAEPLTSILERIRQDVGYYEVQAARWRADIDDPTERDQQSNTLACSITDLDFDVTNVQATLQTALAGTATGNVGLQVPFFGKEGSLSADVSQQMSRTETITITRRFRYSPDELKKYQKSEDYQTLEKARQQFYAQQALGRAQVNPVLPIADTLIELRDNLIRSAEKLPCFEWADKEVKPESSSITLEFLVQQAANGNVGFNFWIASAETGVKAERTNVNTLVVSFAPHMVATPTDRSVAQQLGPPREQPWRYM